MYIFNLKVFFVFQQGIVIHRDCDCEKAPLVGLPETISKSTCIPSNLLLPKSIVPKRPKV